MNDLKLRTKVEITPNQIKTGYQQYNLFLGSCFTENIGNKMHELKYPSLVNPFGVLYNPVSIANGIDILLENRIFTQNDIFFSDGLWHSFNHHSKFSGNVKTQVLKQINAAISEGNKFLHKSDFLFLTFGTAWVYENKSNNQIVSNCHKLPEKKFKRFRLSISQIVTIYSELIKKLLAKNPDLHIIFTVSPVRHWKDGAHENQKSKAILLLAIDELLNTFSHKNVSYFPAYEIVMDELRDYRFYNRDMIHISEMASDYIWNNFKEWIINKKDKPTEKMISKIVKAKNHRPFNKHTKEHLNFCKKTIKNILEINETNPNLKLTLEKEFFMAEISEIEKIMGKKKTV